MTTSTVGSISLAVSPRAKKSLSSPVKGPLQYLYDQLYELEHLNDPDYFEIGDRIIDGYDIGRKFRFAKVVNEVAKQLGIMERVRLLKELNDVYDKESRQRDDFILCLDKLCERVHENPRCLLALPGYPEHRDFRELEDIRIAAEKYAERNLIVGCQNEGDGASDGKKLIDTINKIHDKIVDAIPHDCDEIHDKIQSKARDEPEYMVPNAEVISAELEEKMRTHIFMEMELAEELDRDFIRHPINEKTEFRILEYIGRVVFFNTKFWTTYRAHVWLVDFIVIAGVRFWNPKPGVLEVDERKWEYGVCAHGLPPAEIAFKGRCSLVADAGKWVCGISSDMGD
jgi:hypothetical protein